MTCNSKQFSAIQIRRGSSTSFSSSNIILASGEPAYAIDTKVFKIGDGVTPWNTLTSPLGAGSSPTQNGGGVVVNNSGDNRVLTSTGSSSGIYAENNLTFDGSLLNINGSGNFITGLFVSGIPVSVSGHSHNISQITNLPVLKNANLSLQAKDESGGLDNLVVGNPRGAYSVDLQTFRTVNTRVTTGTHSVIGGGAENEINGSSSTISGGESNRIDSNQSVIGGGFSNYIEGYRSSILGGVDNIIISDNSTIVGGSSNEISSNNTTIGGGLGNICFGNTTVICGGASNYTSASYATITGGVYGVADRYGMESYSAGNFGGGSVCQRVNFILRNVTTGPDPTNLFLDGSSIRLTIPSGRALFATINICGIITSGGVGGSKALHYMRRVAIKNVGGTTTLIGSPQVIGTDIEDDAAYDVSVSADNTNDSLSIIVTGKSGETIRWAAHVQGIEISY